MQLRLTPVVKVLLIINLAVFVLGYMISSFYHIDYTGYLAMSYFQSDYFHSYQVLTHFFVHFTISHLVFNMFGLFSFGPVLESLWGAKKFLFFYIFCALGSAMLHSSVNFYQVSKVTEAESEFIANPTPEYFISLAKISGTESFFTENQFIKEFEEHPGDPKLIEYAISTVHEIDSSLKNSFRMAGASGAIFGLLVAFGMLFPNTELMLMFIPFPIKAKYFVLIYAGIELFLGVSNYKWDSVAHFAHLGGALFGFILVKYWQKQRNTFY